MAAEDEDDKAQKRGNTAIAKHLEAVQEILEEFVEQGGGSDGDDGEGGTDSDENL